MAQGPSIFLSQMMKLFSQFNDATRDLDGVLVDERGPQMCDKN